MLSGIEIFIFFFFVSDHLNTHTWILSIFSTFHRICLLFIFFILVGVKLHLCVVVTLS